METCKTCQQWTAFKAPFVDAYGSGFGVCLSASIYDKRDGEVAFPDETKVIVDGMVFWASGWNSVNFVTGMEFGCIHHWTKKGDSE